MSSTNDHDQSIHDAYVGISREDLEVMPDSELAQWQHNHIKEPPLVTLAEREWERRIISHQLSVQYDLDSRLANASEKHAERIAESNRWWGFASALLGVIGTLSGVALGKWLDSPNHGTSAIPQAQSHICRVRSRFEAHESPPSSSYT